MGTLIDTRGGHALDHLLLVGVPGAAPTWLTEPLPDDVWGELCIGAQRERLLPLLHAAVRAGFPATDRQHAEAAALRSATVMTSLAQDGVIARVVHAFARDGIETRLLKGHATGRTVYPDPTWRQSGDVDLFVPAHQFAPAVGVLVGLGAEIVPGLELGPRFARLEKARTFRLDGVEVDLHRRVEGEVGRYAITESDLLGRPVTVSVGGTAVRVPPAEVNLVHAALHLSSVRARRSALADVVRLARHEDLDVREAVAVAARGGSLPVLDWALAQAATVAPVPGSLRAAVAAVPTSRRDRLARRLVLEQPHLRVLVQLADAPVRHRPGLAREVLWPAPEFLRRHRRSRLGHLRHVLTPTPAARTARRRPAFTSSTPTSSPTPTASLFAPQ